MFKHTLQNSADLKNFCYQAEMHPVAKRLDLDQLIGWVPGAMHPVAKRLDLDQLIGWVPGAATWLLGVKERPNNQYC